MNNQSNTLSNSLERKLLFVLGSSRHGGNTETLAKIAADKLPSQIEKRWLRLTDFALSPFQDTRHTEAKGIHPPTENERILLDETLWATDLVIASPLYWYSVSSATKLYLDYWTYWMRLPEINFLSEMKGKTMWVICALSDEESEKMSKPLVEMLELTAEYMQMNSGGVLLGYGNRPGDVLNDKNSIERAEKFFSDVK